MVQTWTVVKFIKENSYEAVPTSWVDGNLCYWPSAEHTKDQIQRFIRYQHACDKSWGIWDVKLFKNGTFTEYLTARHYTNKVQSKVSSSSGSELSLSELDCSRKRKRKRNRIYDSDSDEKGSSANNFQKNKTDISDSDSSENEIGVSNIGTPPQLNRNKVWSPKLSPIVENTSSALTTPKSRTSLNCTCCPIHNKTEDSIQQIVRKQNLIHASQLQILDELKILKNQRPEELEDGFSIFKSGLSLPVNTANELATLETFLNDQDNFKKCAKELCAIGGDSAYEFISRAIPKIFTQYLAATYSYEGKGAGKKNKFCLLKFNELLIDALKRNKSTREINLKEYENAMRKYLKRSPERANAEMARRDRNRDP